MPLLETSFFVLVLCLLIFAVLRLRQTESSDPELASRRDMAGFLAITAVVQTINLIRGRYPFASVTFWVCTVVALPMAFMALWLLWRLLARYVQSRKNS